MNGAVRERLLASPEPMLWSRNSDEEVAELRALSYEDYCQTPYWRWRHRRALWLARYQCQSCGTSREVLQAHHLTYDRLGEELDDDLVVLCRPCHQWVDHTSVAGREDYCPMPDDVREALAAWARRDAQVLGGA